MLLMASLSAATAEPKQVMVLFSFGRDFIPWSEYAKTIRTELDRQSPWPLDITEHSLVTARSSDDNPEAPFVEYLRALYAKRQPDLIVSIGAPAAAFVQRHRQQLFPKTPMVFTAVEQRRVQFSSLTPLDAVVALHIDYLGAFENILRVLPDTKNVAIVVGTSPIEKFWRAEEAKVLKPLEDRIALTWYDDLSFEDILKRAATLPPHSAIFWELMLIDAAGVVHEGDTALKRLHAVANAPMFSYDESFFGGAIVGGPFHSVLEVSRRTAAVAIRILGGETAGDIKTPPIEFGPPKFDWREMQRWGISESSLPPGSEILFRTPTIWDQYRAQIVAVCALVLALVALVSWLLYERGQRRRSEAAAHEISGRLINAQEEERARLARELHDDITQRLAALAIETHRIEHSSAPPAAMSFVREGLVRLSEDVHALSYRLHPAILRDLGLIEALRAECEGFSECPVQLKVNAEEITERLPQDVALYLFRIAQESLRNVARHARASQTEVRLRRLDRGLQLVVRDNGAGFDPMQHRAGMSLGLASMRQRAVLLGGKIDIESSPGHGTTIVAWVPVKEPGDPRADELIE